jgi:hypothetical protein
LNALLLTLFISLILVLLGAVFFVFCFAHRDHEHADRLSLLPLLDDNDEGGRAGAPKPAPPEL